MKLSKINIHNSLLAILALLFLAAVVMSLWWRMLLDSPVLMYVSFSIDAFGKLPYKDIYDFNFPGAYFFNIIIGKVFGYNDLGVRLGDLSFMLLTMFATWMLLKDSGAKRAFVIVLLFGFYYLMIGAVHALQRERMILAPLAFAVWLQFRCFNDKPIVKNFLIGLMFAIAASIKPHSAIGLIGVFAFNHFEARKENLTSKQRLRQLGQLIAAIGAGFSLPLLIIIVYLLANNIFQDFWSMYTNYLPLFRELSSDYKLLSGSGKVFLGFI